MFIIDVDLDDEARSDSIGEVEVHHDNQPIAGALVNDRAPF